MLEKSQKKVWNSLYKNKFSWNLESKIPNICKNKTVLELGVGTGKTLQSIIKQKPKEVHALDFSEEAIKICKLKFKLSNIIFHKLSIIKMPFKKDYFDIISCYFVLNNLKESERIKAVSEIRLVLKPKGLIIFRDFSSEDYRKFSFNKSGLSKDGRYCHFFTEGEVKKLFWKFSSKKIKIETSKPIRKHPEMKRQFIECIFKK